MKINKNQPDPFSATDAVVNFYKKTLRVL